MNADLRRLMSDLQDQKGIAWKASEDNADTEGEGLFEDGQYDAFSKAVEMVAALILETEQRPAPKCPYCGAKEGGKP